MRFLICLISKQNAGTTSWPGCAQHVKMLLSDCYQKLKPEPYCQYLENLPCILNGRKLFVKCEHVSPLHAPVRQALCTEAASL